MIIRPKKVLLLYTDKYYLLKQVYPFGLDLIANHLRPYGYKVTVDYPFLPDQDVETNLVNILERTDPDVIGIGIRNLDTCMSCEEYGDFQGDDYKTFYFLPEVKRIVEIIEKTMPQITQIIAKIKKNILTTSHLVYFIYCHRIQLYLKRGLCVLS